MREVSATVKPTTHATQPRGQALSGESDDRAASRIQRET